MTDTDAIRYAQHIAVTTQQTAYVIYDPADEDNEPAERYHAGDTYEIETYYTGCEIVHAYDEEGDET